ncbi:MAG: pyridoxamine 5'-phosphate oxidase [Pseudomonadota bacterium]
MPTDVSVIPPTPSAEQFGADADRPLIEMSNDPVMLFKAWLGEATVAEPSDANAMTLATVDATGFPDARIVLLKDVSYSGFTFYTNYYSAKAQQLTANGAAALLFHWKSTERQVRVRGVVKLVAPEEADAYFAERARDSQIGAWASDQSQPLVTREALLGKVAMLKDLHKHDPAIERPPHWGGYRLVPSTIEFWQSQAFRLHDRRIYSVDAASNQWVQARLSP